MQANNSKRPNLLFNVLSISKMRLKRLGIRIWAYPVALKAFLLILGVVLTSGSLIIYRSINAVYLSGSELESYSGQIVYTCKNLARKNLNNICVINGDGTDQRVLTEASEGKSNTNPSINIFDEIVFECDTGEQKNICFINSDGTGFKQLTHAKESELFTNPQINARSEILFVCSDNDYSHLCVFDRTQTQYKILTEQTTYQQNTMPKFNSFGEVVYSCKDNNIRFPSLCYILSNGNNFKVVLDSIRPEQRINFPRFPAINQRGKIVFLCSRNYSSPEICELDSYSSSPESIKEIDLNPPAIQNYSKPSINNNGDILFDCYNAEICFIDGVKQEKLFLTSSSVVNENNRHYFFRNSILSNDWVVSECWRHSYRDICIMKSDGTRFRILTNAKSGQSNIDPDIH